MTDNHITAKELHDLISKGMSETIVVDVRTEEEFKKGAISGAINIPVDKLALLSSRLFAYNKIYLYCLSGGRSEFALNQLPSLGVKGEIYNLTSGLLAWRKEGYSLV